MRISKYPHLIPITPTLKTATPISPNYPGCPLEFGVAVDLPFPPPAVCLFNLEERGLKGKAQVYYLTTLPHWNPWLILSWHWTFPAPAAPALHRAYLDRAETESHTLIQGGLATVAYRKDPTFLQVKLPRVCLEPIYTALEREGVADRFRQLIRPRLLNGMIRVCDPTHLLVYLKL